MRDFEYHAPATLKEALYLLEEKKGGARPLAGGTDLIVQMKYGWLHPSSIIDIKKIPELSRLEWDAGTGLFVGAAAPLNRMNAFPPVASEYDLLYDACSLIGSFQLRSRATTYQACHRRQPLPVHGIRQDRPGNSKGGRRRDWEEPWLSTLS
jgi:carbon-monoxide dehydrogenase medium subunit